MAQTLKTIRNTRIEKIAKLRELGIDPYPAKAHKEFANARVVENFDKFEGRVVTLTGRIRSWREHGKLIFAHLQDESGNIQLFIQANKLSETSKESGNLGFSDLKLLDVGDFIQTKGEVAKTTRGEVSLIPHEIKLLTKSLRPLPDKWEGMTDPELIFRKRYLDLIMKPERREMFVRKAKFWAANREFMKSRGFIEVETPILEHFTGGADAKPFKTHHNALDEDFYLRISTELYQKRLIGAGFEKIYTVGPNFRNEGIDDEHLQEYYQIEWYWAYATYKDMMAMLVEMFRHITKEVYGRTKFESKGHTFDLADEWQEVDYVEIIKEKFGIDIFNVSDEELLEVVKNHGIKLDGAINRNRLIDNLWKLIRKEISGPAFLINEPKFMSPLAKSRPENRELTERFHIIIAGSELGNGYSELNDPIDQYQRFLEQQAARDAGDDEAQMMDIDYVEMLEYGMPPTAGYAHSERLFWFLENATAREATLFPQMKYKSDESVKEIYPDFKMPKKSAKKHSKDAYIEEEVLEKFPGTSFAYTVIKNVQIKKEDKELDELKSKILEQRSSLNLEDIKAMPSITTYRMMLKSTGVDVNSNRPSPEALLRRIAQGKGLYTVNTAVDAYNLAVIETGIGLGAFDLSKITTPKMLRFSKEGEEVVLLGDDSVTKTKKGQLVYADSEKLLTVDLNYRDNTLTKITTDTKDILLCSDGGPGIDTEEVKAALKKGAEYIIQFCGGEMGKIVLIQ